MTEARCLAGLLRRKPSVAAGLRAWRLAAWMRDCIRGKDIVEVGSMIGNPQCALSGMNTVA